MLQGFHTEGVIEAGCDEAGRGCLAGPVFAAAVILPQGFQHPLLRDSKKMTASMREEAKALIQEIAVSWAVGYADPEEIDRINILNASFLAMHRAIAQLTPVPENLLIDGNRFKPFRKIPFYCIVKGDGAYASIAAASILAKTGRDEYMLDQSRYFPLYGWVQNKGYPTAAHREAIRQYGLSPLHRKSFRLLPDGVQGELF
ncbi:MAG: ribonuclease HII [Haliscomenobacter sp.]|nr:ribonuclease HII [Haliscomenobacter sp.]MBK7477171.1 ribonuclease HII [Haliscomenobacter sp.]